MTFRDVSTNSRQPLIGPFPLFGFACIGQLNKTTSGRLRLDGDGRTSSGADVFGEKMSRRDGGAFDPRCCVP